MIYVCRPPSIDLHTFRELYPSIRLPDVFAVTINQDHGSHCEVQVVGVDLVLEVPIHWLVELPYISPADDAPAIPARPGLMTKLLAIRYSPAKTPPPTSILLQWERDFVKGCIDAATAMADNLIRGNAKRIKEKL